MTPPTAPAAHTPSSSAPHAVQYPKRLIEVDLPIKRISAHARREKSIRHGHISTLHIWWARRPLAACRAVVCASLWPDPGDPICPERFTDAARRLMVFWAKECLKRCSADSYPQFNRIAKAPPILDDPAELRRALLDFIADFANWDNSTDAHYLAVARTLTVAAHDALEGLNAFTLPASIGVESLNEAIRDAPRPLLVDPFAGGGAIPLEGLRCGADAFASDLNPVAVLLNKVVLEYIPKYGKRLADEVEKWGKWIKDEAEKELAEFYPKDPDGATPIAYLWARTITCEGPGCGAEVPLMRSLWLAKKGDRSIALQIVPRPEKKRCEFVIVRREDGAWVCQEEATPQKGGDTEESKEHAELRKAVARRLKDGPPRLDGTVARGSATCPCCGFTTPVKSVRAQLKTRRGGANDARLFAVVTTRPGQKGRFYRLPTDRDLEAVRKAGEELERRKKAHTGELSLVPDEPLPPQGSLGFRVQPYGMTRWGDLFSNRQLLGLTTFAGLVRQVEDEGVRSSLALCVGRQSDYLTSLVVWAASGGFIAHTFGRQALPIVWEWPECCPLEECSGNWQGAVGWVKGVLRANAQQGGSASVLQVTATDSPLPSEAASSFITDPPYYDAVPYSDLSDFFYVWLRRCLPGAFQEALTPKVEECIVDETKGKDRQYFESSMKLAMQEGRRILGPPGIGCVVFAHKSTGGWEAQLQAMAEAGWIITGSWPIDTERPGRLRAQNSAALASSIHLVCRPREDSDGNLIERVGDWRDVLAELPGRIAAWLPRLAAEGVVGADAIFACLGPALEIYSRYSSVEKTSGEVVPLREYLEQVWAEVARQALNMIFEGADASGFEEDARLTAMWLWTLRTDAGGQAGDEDGGAEDDDGKAKSLRGYALEYDAARKIAQGLGCHLENLDHLVEIQGDTATLLSAEARARRLFGKDEGATATSKGRKKKKQTAQMDLFAVLGVSGEEDAEAGAAELDRPAAGKTVLDQLHQSMLLFTAGRGAALKRFLVDDGIGANPHFWTLAQALSALYPANTNEKRWVDGVLARKKGLGL